MFDPAVQSAIASVQAAADAKVSRVALMADLKALQPTAGAQVQLVGKYAATDGLGGFYYWDPASTLAEDLTYMNVLVSTVPGYATSGRWIRSFQKAVKIVGATTNVLTNTGGVKTLYAPGMTDSAGKVVINLTVDNTATGTPVFSEVWLVTPQQSPMNSSSSSPVIGYGVVSQDLKTCSCYFSQSSTTTLGATLLAIAGAIVKGLSPVPSGVPVQIKVEGN